LGQVIDQHLDGSDVAEVTQIFNFTISAFLGAEAFSPRSAMPNDWHEAAYRVLDQ
jgi:hypothetical protein